MLDDCGLSLNLLISLHSYILPTMLAQHDVGRCCVGFVWTGLWRIFTYRVRSTWVVSWCEIPRTAPYSKYNLIAVSANTYGHTSRHQLKNTKQIRGSYIPLFFWKTFHTVPIGRLCLLSTSELWHFAQRPEIWCKQSNESVADLQRIWKPFLWFNRSLKISLIKSVRVRTYNVQLSSYSLAIRL